MIAHTMTQNWPVRLLPPHRSPEEAHVFLPQALHTHPYVQLCTHNFPMHIHRQFAYLCIHPITICTHTPWHYFDLLNQQSLTVSCAMYPAACKQLLLLNNFIFLIACICRCMRKGVECVWAIWECLCLCACVRMLSLYMWECEFMCRLSHSNCESMCIQDYFV